MIPLQMIMGDESADTHAEMILSQGNHPTKALAFDGPHKAFGVGVQIRTCAFYLFIRQPMGRKSALRREIPWILRGFQGRLSY